MQSDAKSNRDFGLQSFQLMSGKSFRIQEHLKTQSGEENFSNPVGHLVLTLTLDSGTFIEGLSKYVTPYKLPAYKGHFQRYQK